MDILRKKCNKAVYTVLILLPHLQAHSLFRYLCPGNISLSYQNADSIWIQNRSYISIEIECENHACIMLHQNEHDYHTNATEIHLLKLNGTGLSFIIDSETRRFNWTHDPSLLSSFNYRLFWISWTKFDIRVGKGDKPDKSQILQLQKLPYTINYLNIGTNCTGRSWRLKRGDSFTNVTTEAAVYASATLKSTTSSNSEEDGDNEGTLIVYISVSIVVIIAVIITLTIYLLHRRIKHIRRSNTESAVYNGIDTTFNRRLSVPGIMNRAYSSYTLEIQDNSRLSNTDLPQRNDSLYTKIDKSGIESFKVLGSGDTKNDIYYPQGIEEDKYGYNHVKKPNQEGNDESYSHVTKTLDGFEVENDTCYSHIVSRPDDLRQNLPGKDGNTGSMYNVINASPRVIKEQYKNTTKPFGDQDSTYDHAKAGGPDPPIKEADEYSHLSESKEEDQSHKLVRHGYENVLQANDLKYDECYQFLEQDHYGAKSESATGYQSDQVNYANRSEVSNAAPRLRYVNVTKNTKEPFTISEENVTREYEEAFGHTPPYFVIEP